MQKKPFEWIRGYQVGGKSLIWGRACPRWSKYEFINPAKYGYGIEWPMGYDDIAPWYSHVETFAGICGNKDGIESMPDGEYLPPFEFNCAEKDIKQKLESKYKDRFFIQGRWAQLSATERYSSSTGKRAMPGKRFVYAGMPVWRVFQFQLVHTAMGRKNGQS